MKDDRLYLIHISECLARINVYVAGGREAFLSSSMTQDAVLRNLQTMAESTQRLSEAFKATHAEIEWKEIAGFRNVLVHDDLGVDLPYVWEIIDRDLPVLKRHLLPIMQAMGLPPEAA